MNSSTSPVSFQRITEKKKTEQSCGEIFLVLHCLGSRDTQYQVKKTLYFCTYSPLGVLCEPL